VEGREGKEERDINGYREGSTSGCLDESPVRWRRTVVGWRSRRKEEAHRV
jgi:hypothetical protein